MIMSGRLADLSFWLVYVTILTVQLTGGLSEIQDHFKIVSDRLPTDVRFRPPIGNGHIATNVFSDTVYMNGLYNGRGDRSSRARIPSYVTIDVNLTSDKILDEKYILDMYNGLFIKEIQTSSLNITITSYAHRKFYQLLITRLSIQRSKALDRNLTVYLRDVYGKDSADFNWLHQRFKENELENRESMYRCGRVRETELEVETPAMLHVYHTVIPTAVEIPSGTASMSVTYVASHSTNQTDAFSAYGEALHQQYDDVLALHKKEWTALWESGRIDVFGNEALATDITAAIYNILCSLPSVQNRVTPFFGLGPGGLSRGGLLYPERPGGPRNDYAGHVFWDMDTWIMPPIMMFHPSMARNMIEARLRVLDQAKINARASGYKGAKFSWEQASTGIETTPKWAGNMSLYEIHVTADVAYGLRQYLYASDDVTLLTEDRGLEMALEIARFWLSRVTETESNTVEILGVMGPDEYHFNVDNSVFTNYNAKLSLTLPQFIIDQYSLKMVNTTREELETFASVAKRMLILFDQGRHYHPQYQNFNLSASIKQSDVVLLGYPLMMPMATEIRRNDLELYEKITDEQGPDTGTWSMHTVGWLELGDTERAYKNFRMMFRNINEPFKVFSEKPVSNSSYGGCVNFITGAGGLLQSIVFGYGGLRLHSDRLELNPTPLYNTTSWCLKGIHYKTVVFDITIKESTVQVAVVKMSKSSRVIIETANRKSDIRLQDSFTFKRQIATIRIHSKNSNTSYVTAESTATSPSPTPVSAAINGRITSNYHKLTAVQWLFLTVAHCFLFI